MKRFLLLLLITGAVSFAQEQPSAATDEMLPSQQAFLNLAEEERKEFAELFTEATRLFRQKRIFETLEAIDNAEKIFDQSAALLNLKGSCYVEIRAFDKAMASFEEALEIDPENLSIQFNVAEVLFVSKQWQKAHDKLVLVLARVPEGRDSFARLIEFKVLLCKSKLGLDEEVLILAEKYGYQDDSPYYYYAKAALAYESEDLLEAEQWLARANRIFRDPNIIAPWQDTLVEFGYIKSFYGSDETES